MSDWFAAVGTPLRDDEREALGEALRGLSLFVAPGVRPLADWHDALAGARDVDRDGSWWAFEEDARSALWSRAAERLGEDALATRLAQAGEAHAAHVDALAAALSSRAPGEALEAARLAASLALHQHAVARLAGAPATHWFHRKHAWFERGRWPVGALAGRFLIF